ncbi:MAG: DedA family protein [Victivallales bacterium]|nr:DedA family protein [Victivallales bacterium]
MSEQLVEHLAELEQYAPAWGYLIVFLLMTIESSFIPFPSEVIMIPAGFLAARGALSCGIPWLDGILAVIFGLAGSMAGAYVNYFLAYKMGEPFLRKYGKYIFLKPATLDRASEIFRKYGDMATFVCRLIPAIRQLISLPAGLTHMNFRRFSIFTALGAGVWTAILTGIGFYCGYRTSDMGYPELVEYGKRLLHDHYGWILGGLALFCVLYIAIQRRVMRPSRESSIPSEPQNPPPSE